MNTIFATSASPVRRGVLATLLALSFVLLTLTGAAHTPKASAACTSHITSVSAFNTNANQTQYIRGQCLGTNAPYKYKDSQFLYIHFYGYNGSAAWDACYQGDNPPDTVTCWVQSWTENQITFRGFGGQFNQNGYVIYENEYIDIQVLNPQNPVQWSGCLSIVGRGGCS